MPAGDPTADVNFAVQMGLVNALRTGDMLYDTFTTTLVPVAMSAATNVINHIRPTVETVGKAAWRLGRTEYVRTISYDKTISCWSVKDGANANNKILQKAIMLYISEKKLLQNSEHADLKLMPIGAESSSGPSYNRQFGTTAEQLEQYTVHTSLTSGVWLEVEPELMLFIRNSEDAPANEEEEAGNVHCITYEFRCSASDGLEKVDAFIEKAYEWYTELIGSQTDKGRYMYIMQASGAADEEEDDGNKGPKYKRYKLVGNKTFDSLFLPEKQSLINLLDQFMSREGKFAIPGFPLKLGLLLYGPPGTGKTSMIKALAAHTGRNIVNVPLGRIKTNQELMDCMFDLKFNVPGQDMPIQMDFKKIIFVLEDVDAATSVVHKRSGGDSSAAFTSDGSDSDDEDIDNVDMMKHMLNEMMMMQAMNASMGDGVPGAKMGGGIKSFEIDKTDELDLSGVLNVLDGVVDCPERILVMTTNHPEKLDPALIRPGRINLKLHLNYMQAPEMMEMLAHYFGEVNSVQERSANAAFKQATSHGIEFTPAQLEQLCAEADQVEDFVQSLQCSYEELEK